MAHRLQLLSGAHELKPVATEGVVQAGSLSQISLQLEVGLAGSILHGDSQASGRGKEGCLERGLCLNLKEEGVGSDFTTSHLFSLKLERFPVQLGNKHTSALSPKVHVPHVPIKDDWSVSVCVHEMHISP